MRAVLIEDVVVGAVGGDGASGPAIPAAMRGIPLDRLRWDGSRIIDAVSITTFHVGSDGIKHVIAAPGRQEVACAWDDVLVRDGIWRVMSASEKIAPRIKAECRRRILTVVNETAQINLAAAAAGGDLSEEDMAAYRQGLRWIASMRDACRALIGSADETFRDDNHWPPAAAQVVDLSGRF